ncbi:MAG TPA: DUF4252 domain-containing protein [Steroidobacteraceae bacterium]|nr:DUF4252 domain-containing protein [Steroidobacteraceae bacterium]
MISLLLPLAPALAAAQSARLVLPDFSALAKKATESVNISLDPSLLGFASGALGSESGGPALKDLMAGVQGVYVRSFKFDVDGAYSKADVDAVRAQLVAPQWAALVSTHDRKQHSNVDIFVNRKSAHSEGGMAIITSTPREFTIVNIVGSIDLAKLEQLQGRFGVPRIDVPRIDVPKGDVPKGDAGH